MRERRAAPSPTCLSATVIARGRWSALRRRSRDGKEGTYEQLDCRGLSLKKSNGSGQGKTKSLCTRWHYLSWRSPALEAKNAGEKMKRTPTFHCLSLFLVQCTARWQIEAHSSSPHLSTPRINSARGLLRTRNENCVASHENSIEPR